MQIDITIKNYRCFSDSNPAKISLYPGITSFVGPNNAGKSTILKFFYEFRAFFNLFTSNFNPLMTAIQNQSAGVVFPTIDDPAQIFYNGNNRPLEIIFDFSKIDTSSKHPLPNVNTADYFILFPKKLHIIINRHPINWAAEVELSDGTKAIGHSFTATEYGISFNSNKIIDCRYIKDVFSNFSNSLYIGPFRNAINLGSNENYFDIRVGQAAITNWRELKQSGVSKNRDKAYELTDNIRRIFDFRDLDLNSSSDDQTLFIRANNKNYSLSELGSGFTQFFLMFLSAAIRDPKPKFILIDEPELNLHPSLQLDFLTALGSYASEGLLFATHNYGLARAASERIYLVRKTPEGESIVEPNDGTTHLSTFLGELGFSAYHDLGFDKILLVEGPSELKTIQQFLRLYQKDHKFVLIHLGGGSSIHGGIGDQLEEMKRITPNISVVIDSEKANPNAILEKRIMEFENACKIAGVSCMILKRRAMENYFPDASIRKALGEHYKQLGHYEKLSEAKTPWNKNFNWRIAREMDIKDLEGTDLGEFLNSL